MMLIADGGSTKTDWSFCASGKLVKRFITGGMNPYILSDDDIRGILCRDVLSQSEKEQVNSIFYYGAGCREAVVPRMTSLFENVFPNAEGSINVYSDMLAAARALFGNNPGIACILGTGSNSCYYDGSVISSSVPPMGYVLGDEGSGTDIGKHLVNAIFKRRMPEDICTMFHEETQLTLDDVIRKTYREGEPGRFLASLTRFASYHIGNKEIADMVASCFRSFFRNNISAYNASGCCIGAVGSIAHYFCGILQKAAEDEGFTISKIIKSPMDGLLEYHGIRIEKNNTVNI